MSARLDPNPPSEFDALIRDAEFQTLRRLTKLVESENECVALRACEVVLRYARDRRREGAEAPAKTDPKPPVPKVKVPEKLVHPPAPKPAFRAVPLDKLAALAELTAPRRE